MKWRQYSKKHTALAHRSRNSTRYLDLRVRFLKNEEINDFQTVIKCS